MTNLLRAHFARLWKSKLFWLCLLGAYILGVTLGDSAVMEYAGGYGSSDLWGEPLCGFGLLSGIVCAALFSLFFGAEYADGALRNKLIAGHSRTSVYLSVLVTSFLAALMIYAASLAASLFPGPLQGLWNLPAPDTAAAMRAVAGTALMIMAGCAICTAFCMLIRQRAVLAVALILFMVALFVVSLQVGDRYETVTASAMEMFIGPNGPEYIWHQGQEAGPVLTFLYDFLPVSQAFRYMSLEATPVLLAYAALLTAVTTAAGLFFFRRENIT